MTSLSALTDLKLHVKSCLTNSLNDDRVSSAYHRNHAPSLVIILYCEMQLSGMMPGGPCPLLLEFASFEWLMMEHITSKEDIYEGILS